ncbi:MAG: hypothetical protein HZC36_01190 [Armatimonadetes bacterium]|nr:hypothetical protein [Armatimonadota bacterium]
MIAALIFITLARHGHSDLLQQRFSFEGPAATVSQVLASLSSATGTTLTVSGPISKDILILSFRDAPLGEVLKEIGQATSASWTSRGDGYVLSRSSQDVASITERLRSEIREPLRTLLDEMGQFQDRVGPLTFEKMLARYENERLEEQRRFDSRDIANQVSEEVESNNYDYERDRQHRLAASLEFSAGSRFILGLLRRLGPDELAKLCAGSHTAIVLATNPTKLERPLTVSASQWRQFVAENNASAAAFEKVHEKDKVEEDDEDSLRVFSAGAIRFAEQATKIAAQLPRKVILKLNPMIDDTAAIYVEMNCYGQDGSQLMGAFVGLESMQVGKADTEAPSQALGEPVLEISPLGREYANLISWDSRDDRGRKPSADLLERLLRPDAYEPLSLLASEALIKASAQRGRNLAACLPDSYINCGFGLDDLKATSSSVLEFFGGYGSRLEDRDGWFLIRPADPQWDTECRLSRNALTQLKRAVARTNMVTIGDYAAYAAKTNNDTEGTANDICESEFHSLMSDASFDPFWLAKAYGSLTEIQRMTLRRGGRVYFGELMPAVKETFLRFFLEDARVDLQEVFPQSEDELEDAKQLYSDLEREKTQFFVHGLDSHGWIELQEQSDAELEMLYVDADGGTVSTSSSEEGIALILYMRNHPELQDKDSDPIDYSKAKFCPSTRLRASFTFNLAPYLTCSAELSHHVEDPKDAFTLQNLPANLVQRLPEYFKQFDQQVKDGELGPPPPKAKH